MDSSYYYTSEETERIISEEKERIAKRGAMSGSLYREVFGHFLGRGRKPAVLWVAHNDEGYPVAQEGFPYSDVNREQYHWDATYGKYVRSN